MNPLIVKLPGVSSQRQSNRLKHTKTKKSVETKKSSKSRVAEWRRKQRENPEKLAELREKKRLENLKYKDKINALRKDNKAIDEKIKKDQRKWQKNSRLRCKPKATSSLDESSSVGGQPVSAEAVRKTAQRVREKLPCSPKSWSKVMKHIIHNATPTRKSLLAENIDQNNNCIDQCSFEQVEGLNQVGRPTKLMSEIKKKLAFSEPAHSSSKSSYSLRRYRKRASAPKRLHKAQSFHQNWQPKIIEFLDANSRIMPNKKDTVLLDGVRVAKRHLLTTKFKTYKMFIQQHPSYTKSFKTFVKKMPKNYKKLDLTCRRVCVCTKDYNMDQKIEALKKLAANTIPNLDVERRHLSGISLCQPVSRQCIDRQCGECGTEGISNYLHPLIEATVKPNDTDDPAKVQYTQWELCNVTYKGKPMKKWKQIEKLATVEELISIVKRDMEEHSGHIFRADYQHRVETEISHSLPMSHCLAIMDFSENITLSPQDEIESAHWTQTQVTLHPVHIVRHAPESTVTDPKLMTEAFIILSDRLCHDARAVYMFTQKVIRHIQKNPGPCEIDVMHRFSDNCAVQYKCAEAFSHLPRIYIDQGMKVFYHYTESGHGKGPSDGLGATTKRKLDRLILGGRIVSNAYQAYLALVQNEIHVQRKDGESRSHTIVYVPAKEIEEYAPKLCHPKTIKGTQKFHMIRVLSNNHQVIVCDDLSCSCSICLGVEEGPCCHGQFRHPTKMIHLHTARQVTSEQLITTADRHSCNTVGDGIHSAEEQSMQAHENFQVNAAEEMSRFEEQVDLKGWRIRGHSPSDGNCCFWSISDQLDRTGASQLFTMSQLRNNVVEYMRNLPEEEKVHIGQFMTSDVETYLQDMQRNGTYADHICIDALSKVLSCAIVIVHADRPDIKVGTARTTSPLMLGYLPKMKHYVSLEQFVRSGDFVAVRLRTLKDKPVLYIAKVMEVDSQEVQLKFLQADRSPNSSYSWPRNDDISWQSTMDIIRRLSPPKLLQGRGLRLQFTEEEIRYCSQFL